MNNEKLKELIPKKFKMQIYRKIIFSAAADLMREACLNVKFNSFYEIYDAFSPIVDYNCFCFKIVNKHSLKFVKTGENYNIIKIIKTKKHYKEKNVIKTKTTLLKIFIKSGD